MKKGNKNSEAILNEIKRITKNLCEAELKEGQRESMGYVINKLACLMLGEISVKEFHKLIRNTSEENKDYYVDLLGGKKHEKKAPKKGKKEKKEKKEVKDESVKDKPKKVEPVKEDPAKEEPKTPKAKAEEKKKAADNVVNKADDKS